LEATSPSRCVVMFGILERFLPTPGHHSQHERLEKDVPPAGLFHVGCGATHPQPNYTGGVFFPTVNVMWFLGLRSDIKPPITELFLRLPVVIAVMCALGWYPPPRNSWSAKYAGFFAWKYHSPPPFCPNTPPPPHFLGRRVPYLPPWGVHANLIKLARRASPYFHSHLGRFPRNPGFFGLAGLTIEDHLGPVLRPRFGSTFRARPSSLVFVLCFLYVPFFRCSPRVQWRNHNDVLPMERPVE